MTLSQNGIDFICRRFGDGNNCCVKTGLAWYYTIGTINYSETGGTAQIVARLASGLIDSLTMTTPSGRPIATQSEMNAANNGTVTIQDAQTITQHDEPTEQQWCYIPGAVTCWKCEGKSAVSSTFLEGTICGEGDAIDYPHTSQPTGCGGGQHPLTPLLIVAAGAAVGILLIIMIVRKK